MTRTHAHTPSLDDDYEIEGLDELEQNPRFVAALEDAESRHQLLVNLIAQRKAMRLTQTQVARDMETTQSAVSELESGAVDPHLSTLQRYARAVAATVSFRVGLPADCNWHQSEGWQRATQSMRYAGRQTNTAPVRSNEAATPRLTDPWGQRRSDGFPAAALLPA